jgi:hypothetical protein
MTQRRELLVSSLVGVALAGVPPAGAAPAQAAAGPSYPWARRLFHMFTGPDGESVIRELPVPRIVEGVAQRLLRRSAERVTLGTMPPNYLMDFHVANQPNILVPLFGSLVVQLKDGSEWIFRLGDILYAEDCTGGGHKSGAGPDGCFSISVQVPKVAHCVDPELAPANVLEGGDGPRA